MTPEEKAWSCCDCGKDTSVNAMAPVGSKDYYMVTNDLWDAYGAKEQMLCIDCLEKRIGRKLVADDFMDCLLNTHHNEYVANLKGIPIENHMNDYLLLSDNVRIDPLYFNDLKKDHHGVPTFSDLEINKPVIIDMHEYGRVFGVNCMQAAALTQQNFMQRAKEMNWQVQIFQLTNDRVKLWYKEL